MRQEGRRDERHPLRAFSDRTVASWATPTAPSSAMRGAREAAADSCCGSRISTRRAAGPSSSTGFTRTCAGSGSTGTSRCWSSRERDARLRRALDAAARARPGLSLLLHPRRYRRALDRAARRRRGALIPAPAAACPTIPSGAPASRTAGGSTRQERSTFAGPARRGPKTTAGSFERRGRRFRRRDPRPQGCAGLLSSRLRRRRCRERRDPGRARRRSARLDPDPAAAPDAARPARTGLSPPSARHPRRRPPPGQARPRADAGRDARRRRRRAGARRRPARRASFPLVSPSPTPKAPPCG